MTPPATRTATATTAAVLAGVLCLGLLGAGDAFADDGPYAAPPAEAPVKIDARDSDLKLPEGATLAEPKVIDIKSVVEDIGGEERREETNSDIKFALQAEVLFGKNSAKLSDAAASRIAALAA